MTTESNIINIYTPDMSRPECPDCGVLVHEDVEDPETPWEGLCRNSHKNIFQLESED